jgi:hypothetical protein
MLCTSCQLVCSPAVPVATVSDLGDEVQTVYDHLMVDNWYPHFRQSLPSP